MVVIKISSVLYKNQDYSTTAIM